MFLDFLNNPHYTISSILPQSKRQKYHVLVTLCVLLLNIEYLYHHKKFVQIY